MTTREPANLDESRAQAAERLLERKRMGLESAVEALEAVGYRVVRREDGSYAVRPPYVRTAARSDSDVGKVVGRGRAAERHAHRGSARTRIDRRARAGDGSTSIAYAARSHFGR